METYFDRFSAVIRSLSDADLQNNSVLDGKFRLDQQRAVEICYAPFEYLNPHARLVLVGITPGRTQMVNALRAARDQLQQGVDARAAMQAAQATGAFSGAMRANLVALLDAIGINDWLHIRTCDELFGGGPAAHLVQTASALRYPVFVDGVNYNGAPRMTQHSLLREYLTRFFAEDAQALRNAVFVPLGPKVTEALQFLAERRILDRSRILEGLPHPSGANAERVAYFLGRKSRSALSLKTDPDKLDNARRVLMEQVAACA